MVEPMTFGRALELLKEGKKVARQGWNGKDMHLELQVPDEHSKMTKPYIFIMPDAETRRPWVASQSDMLEEDWVEVE